MVGKGPINFEQLWDKVRDIGRVRGGQKVKMAVRTM